MKLIFFRVRAPQLGFTIGVHRTNNMVVSNNALKPEVFYCGYPSSDGSGVFAHFSGGENCSVTHATTVRLLIGLGDGAEDPL